MRSAEPFTSGSRHRVACLDVASLGGRREIAPIEVDRALSQSPLSNGMVATSRTSGAKSVTMRCMFGSLPERA